MLAVLSILPIADRRSRALSGPDVERIPYDIVGDWLFVTLAWSGVAPYRPLETIDPRLTGRPAAYGPPSKPPAIAMVMAPLLATSPEGAVVWLTVFSVIALVLSVLLSTRINGGRFERAFLAVPLIAVTLAIIDGFFFANPAIITRAWS